MVKFIFAAAILVCLHVQQARASDERTRDLVVDSMRSNMISKTSIDGKLITNIQLRRPCVMQFDTGSGDVVVDWGTVEDLISRSENGSEATDLKSTDTPHTISLPRGPSANRVRASLTMFYSLCGSR